MADGESLLSCVRPNAEAREVARLLRHATYPLRLRLLFALRAGEQESCDLEQLLGERRGAIAAHLDAMCRDSLVRLRNEGPLKRYALTMRGFRIVQAYQAVISESGTGVESPPERPPALPSPGVFSPPPSPMAAASQLLNAASLLNHAAHPLRLRILLLLGEEERDPHRIACDLDVKERWRISQQLAVLRSGALVSRHESRERFYGLTDAGSAMIQVLRSTCSRLASSQGGLNLLPEPITPGVGDALDPTSPDGLAVLLKTFANPLRLRLLNLLAVRASVCICHLHEALTQPRRSILESLAYPKAIGLILEEQAESWPCYRLARPARDLHRSLLGCFGNRLADAETFRYDREKLGHLAPCMIPLAEDDALRTRQLGTRARTA